MARFLSAAKLAELIMGEHLRPVASSRSLIHP